MPKEQKGPVSKELQDARLGQEAERRDAGRQPCLGGRTPRDMEEAAALIHCAKVDRAKADDAQYDMRPAGGVRKGGKK